jgi:hypothetical protein
MQNDNNSPINVELTEEVAEGQYSNLVMIAHSSSEFVFDFIQVVPGMPKAKVKSRLILTPDHAKRLLRALGENIERYEESFSRIRLHDEDGSSFPTNFGGTIGEA